MATDPVIPPSVIDEINELKRRLTNLERSPRLPFSSFKGGTFKFLDEDGNLRVGMGNVPIPSNSFVTDEDAYGFTCYGDDGAIALATREGERGLLYPLQQIAFHVATPVDITSGSFVPAYEAEFHLPPAPVLVVEFSVQSSSGTTGQIRLREANSGGTTSTASVPALANGFVAFEWLHPGTTGLGDDRPSRPETVFFQIEVRRTAGTGSVSVYQPRFQQFAPISAFPNADVNGNMVASF